eukprot:CAMPEP_0206455714 /NCGR_PEP_ID=MMETSP0324_2-20121206/21934_1 /ASSEMBLY_ACC=CAM_ASM_000836 /TAXON_ID=2866 /ORGANISM="Crypthecodinium cohnii, Strain Seligo" /LENGTH=438 /DNA_ID=CAMNT_0053926505 /DNA_START=266 /DNA_END=1582 /DNA_ORIENTATION=-
MEVGLQKSHAHPPVVEVQARFFHTGSSGGWAAGTTLLPPVPREECSDSPCSAASTTSPTTSSGASSAAASPSVANLPRVASRTERAALSRFRGVDFSESRTLALADLADGPYFNIVIFLGTRDLGQADVACRLTRDLNRRQGGPWWALGCRVFRGHELDGDNIFDPTADYAAMDSASGAGGIVQRLTGVTPLRRGLRVDWKTRYARFANEVKMFRFPFCGDEIVAVHEADEIAYYCSKLRTDLLPAQGGKGIYIEVEVLSNPDNVSLAVVDFEAGGCSSVTFSPDTGAVIRERKIREAPRKVEGTYIQPLSSLTNGQGFEGRMALYLKGGQLAFFRRPLLPPHSPGEAREVGDWECTGFVADLSWAEGQRLTPCLAFRDVGAYRLRNSCVGTEPPRPMEKTGMTYLDSQWRSLDWDATDPDVDAEEEVEENTDTMTNM